ncbi:VWA domain-containing protein [Paraflavitalea sp. CAU 1676]|uniref:VWA domain-containing protein n=1 Tax=Paraflavitalea sp. CAU 1676 TaxID=3032598 RepID=UPI0023D99B98|nr:VWA domain-containing protein [Paraflavitalea sp. CAU 1676]MDF2187007.1 VWA domain-containing protein [Paraflavitalea sp. CAU 1676]
MDLRFQHIEYLIGLAAIPLIIALFAWVLHWKKKTTRKIGDEKLVKQLTGRYSPQNYLFKFLLVALSLAAIISGAANLQKPGAMEQVERKGVDVAIALDVSKSMLADDIKPNRLERAKQMVLKLMDQLPDDRVALILFAGRAYMQMPLTTDHSAARMFVQQASPDVVPAQGTVITEALRMSASAFNSKERKFKSIILITDGEDHDPGSVQLAQQLAESGVMINTVGIGSPEGAPIYDPLTNDYKKDQQGNTVITKLNETELQQLASATKGVYVRLTDIESAVKSMKAQLGTIEQTSMDDSAFKNFKNYFPWFLGAALFLLVLEFFFPERKLRQA